MIVRLLLTHDHDISRQKTLVLKRIGLITDWVAEYTRLNEKLLNPMLERYYKREWLRQQIGLKPINLSFSIE
jgi:hypothetical protein